MISSLKSASSITIPLLSKYYVPGLDTRNITVNITKVVTALTVLQV